MLDATHRRWMSQTVLDFFNVSTRRDYFVVDDDRVRSEIPQAVPFWKDSDREDSPLHLPVAALFGFSLARWREFKALYAHLERNVPGCADLFAKLQTQLTRVGLDSKFYPSLVRVLGPLLESPATGYIERYWREIPPEELRRFVDAGVARERVLVNRSHSIKRLQEISRDGPRFLDKPATARQKSGRKRRPNKN